ncbi:MAG: heme exporter protein CcmB [Thermoleophilaceae bacterium]|nr:heme exporter protein CcmB [Thermoleophilaceae bacterium]
MIRSAAAILRKDLRLEVRTKESVPAMVLFTVVVYVLFHFGLDRDTLSGELASGVLWVTLLLAAILGVNRLFAAEQLDGILLAPIDRTAIWLAKAAALFIYLVAVQIVAVPAFALLLLGPGLDPAIVPILLLADLGLAAAGALVAGLASQTRARDLIVPLLLLPLVMPVLIGAARATSPLFGGAEGDLERWLGLLGLYDLVFVLVSIAVFDYLLED